jgi:Tfp pilus assembly protein PilO
VSSRDRTLLIALLGVGLLAGFWFAILGPKQHEAKSIAVKVEAANQRLADARVKARDAQQAKADYGRDYASVVELGEAVPTEARVPSLLYQLESASRDARITFSSIQAAGSGTAASGSSDASSASAASSSAPAGATVGTAGFPTMPFTFSFEGSYADLRHLVDAVNRFVELHGSRIVVRGRLLQIDGISMTPKDEGSVSRVTATVNATAYLLPADQAATNGATPSAPAGATPPAAGDAAATGSSNTSSAVVSTPTATGSGGIR